MENIVENLKFGPKMIEISLNRISDLNHIHMYKQVLTIQVRTVMDD